MSYLNISLQPGPFADLKQVTGYSGVTGGVVGWYVGNHRDKSSAQLKMQLSDDLVKNNPDWRFHNVEVAVCNSSRAVAAHSTRREGNGATAAA